MKRAILPIVIVLAVVATPVLAALAIWQAITIKNQAALIASLTHQQDEQRIQDESLTGKLAGLQKRNDALNSEASQLRSKLSAVPATAAPSATPKPDDSQGKGPLAAYMKMLKDPKMREMIKAQQRITMPMLYADLVKQLHLSAGDADKLYGLLSDLQMARMNDGKNGDPTADATAALKQFLGDDGYAQYESYQKSVSDHMVLNQFSQGLTGQNALSDSQRDGLMQIMSDVRAQMPSSVLDVGSNATMKEQMSAMSNEDQTNQFMQNQEQINQQVIARARSLLTTDQVTALQNYLDQMLKMEQMGIQMSKTMGGGQ
ncbi:MAG: hypothetical protein QM796_04865 [Chthoniobacteraceae bacterium]